LKACVNTKKFRALKREVVVAIKEEGIKERSEGCENFKRGKGLKIKAKVVVGCKSSQRRRGLK